MSATSGYDEERLGELSACCPRLRPGGFRLRRSCPPRAAGSTRSSSAPASTRSSASVLVADLEAALAAAGYEPTDELVDAVRACLPELDQ